MLRSVHFAAVLSASAGLAFAAAPAGPSADAQLPVCKQMLSAADDNLMASVGAANTAVAALQKQVAELTKELDAEKARSTEKCLEKPASPK